MLVYTEFFFFSFSFSNIHFNVGIYPIWIQETWNLMSQKTIYFIFALRFCKYAQNFALYQHLKLSFSANKPHKTAIDFIISCKIKYIFQLCDFNTCDWISKTKFVFRYAGQNNWDWCWRKTIINLNWFIIACMFIIDAIN